MASILRLLMLLQVSPELFPEHFLTSVVKPGEHPRAAVFSQMISWHPIPKSGNMLKLFVSSLRMWMQNRSPRFPEYSQSIIKRWYSDTMWYHVIPCDTMWYHVIPCDTLWYHVIPCDTMWYPCWATNNYQRYLLAFWYTCFEHLNLNKVMQNALGCAHVAE